MIESNDVYWYSNYVCKLKNNVEPFFLLFVKNELRRKQPNWHWLQKKKKKYERESYEEKIWSRRGKKIKREKKSIEMRYSELEWKNEKNYDEKRKKKITETKKKMRKKRRKKDILQVPKQISRIPLSI